MSTITRIPKADGTYSELTPSPNDGVHYTKVRRDDGDSTGVQNGGPGATELIDTFKFSVPTGTTKITVTSKTTNFNLDPGNVQNVLFDGSLSRGALTPVNGWTEVSDEFTGTFSGEIEAGIALTRSAGVLFTTLVTITFEDQHGSLIDELTNELGDTVTLRRVTGYVYDDYDEPTDATTHEDEDIKAIIWRPTERRVVKIVGREFDADQAITVDSNIDISPTRNGIPDRVLVRGHWYDVWNVIQHTHPWTGTKRQAVLLKL